MDSAQPKPQPKPALTDFGLQPNIYMVRVTVKFSVQVVQGTPLMLCARMTTTDNSSSFPISYFADERSLFTRGWD